MDTAREPLSLHFPTMAFAGYRSLSWLKSRLLPADMGDLLDHDQDVEEIGKAVAAQFDRVTGRVLRRTAGVVFETPADQEAIVISCYPIEGTPLIQLVDGAYVSAIAARQVSAQTGIIRFDHMPGDEDQLIRVTSTGGFWCDDGDAMPTGATPLPDDLLKAWQLQCRAVCDAEQIFRQKGAGNFTDKDKREASLRMETLDLIPSVKKTLQLYLRMG